eukprot:UN05370
MTRHSSSPAAPLIPEASIGETPMLEVSVTPMLEVPVKRTFLHVDDRTNLAYLKSFYDDDLDRLKDSSAHQPTQAQFVSPCDRCEERDKNTQKYFKTGELLCTACMVAINNSQSTKPASSEEIEGGPGGPISFYDHTLLCQGVRQSAVRLQTR